MEQERGSLSRLMEGFGAGLSAALFAFGVLVVAVGATGCAKEAAVENAVEQLVPQIPADTSFGSLYPRVNAYLSQEQPDVLSAVRDIRAWADGHIQEFQEGVCAQTQVIYDPDFTRLFGKSTLGVTFPWMHIYIRDGQRAEDRPLWKDASLLASTVLHEYVHAAQRARQARKFLRAGSHCLDDRNALVTRQGVWTDGFEQLKNATLLGSGFSGPEAELLYRWTSPIERAHDEVEAAAATVRWMREHPEELNLFTMGGANNWAYGVQYINQLRLLATSNCFSPHDGTFEEEKRLLTESVPRLALEFQAYEPQMRDFLREQGAAPSALITRLEATPVYPAPIGRDGARCTSAALLELPALPVKPGSGGAAAAGVHFQ